MSDSDVFVVSAARTPIGALQGSLAEVPAPRLGAVAIAGALARAGLAAEHVDLTCMGNVLAAGIGQAPARQAAIFAGVPHAVPALTVNKMCGSGLEAVILGVRAIRAGDARIALVGGMESMTQAPYLLPKARAGYRLGHAEVVDSMIRDGLWDPYGDFHMGEAAERCADELGISREAQDEYARESYIRARHSQESGQSAHEIVPVSVPSKRGDVVVSEDEEPARSDLAKFDKLRPAFRSAGTITAANASKIDDGAAALVLANAAACRARGLVPLARVVAYANHAQAPERFPTAPVFAIEKVLARAGLSHEEIDLFEINEAFAVVALACMRLAKVDHHRLNVRGGAVALGHPIGASGARILTTLLFAMKERASRRGLATLCIGGGEANALILERV